MNVDTNVPSSAAGLAIGERYRYTGATLPREPGSPALYQGATVTVLRPPDGAVLDIHGRALAVVRMDTDARPVHVRPDLLTPEGSR